MEFFLRKNNGEKRKFIIAGITNVLITNLILQILLFSNLRSTVFSTLISQTFNMIFGYVIYSKYIFKIRNNRKIIFIIKYIFMMINIWILNTYLIKIGLYLGLSRNISAFFCIPFLALISFSIQKFWIFKKY